MNLRLEFGGNLANLGENLNLWAKFAEFKQNLA